MRLRKLTCALALLLAAVTVAAHPGHEHHVEGTIAKLQNGHFDVKGKDGGITSFMLVAGTEVTVGRNRAQPSDIGSSRRRGSSC